MLLAFRFSQKFPFLDQNTKHCFSDKKRSSPYSACSTSSCPISTSGPCSQCSWARLCLSYAAFTTRDVRRSVVSWLSCSKLHRLWTLLTSRTCPRTTTMINIIIRRIQTEPATPRVTPPRTRLCIIEAVKKSLSITAWTNPGPNFTPSHRPSSAPMA